MNHRIAELDFLKCVFIVLMVAFHLVYIGDSYPYAKQLVYTFHMPGFLILSGYLARTDRSTSDVFRKLGWLFVPYACMESAYVVMSSLLPVRDGVDVLSVGVWLEKLLLHPLGPYWYLHTLMLCLAIDFGLSRLSGLSVYARLVLFGLVLYGLSAVGLVSFGTALYFVAGAALRWCGVDFGRLFRPAWIAVVPLVLLAAFPENLDRSSLGGVGIVYFTVCLLSYLCRFQGRQLAAATAFVGRNTLPVLLFSPMFTMLSKLFLPLFSFDPSGMAFLVVAVALALAGSFGIAWLMDRLRLSPWFFGKTRVLA